MEFLHCLISEISFHGKAIQVESQNTGSFPRLLMTYVQFGLRLYLSFATGNETSK